MVQHDPENIPDYLPSYVEPVALISQTVVETCNRKMKPFRSDPVFLEIPAHSEWGTEATFSSQWHFVTIKDVINLASCCVILHE